MKILTRWNIPFRAEGRAPGGVHCRKRFCEIMERERVRTYRNGSAFSLLVFDLEISDTGPRPVRFVRYLKTRLRATDEIGWSEERRLCIMLPDTDELGALALAGEITRKMNHEIALITVQVHSRRENLEKYPRTTASPGIVKYEILKPSDGTDLRCGRGSGSTPGPPADGRRGGARPSSCWD
jgi:hypothetical protein